MLSCSVIEGMVQYNLKWLNEIKSDLAWHETKQPTSTLQAERQKIQQWRGQVKTETMISQCGVWRNTSYLSPK